MVGGWFCVVVVWWSVGRVLVQGMQVVCTGHVCGLGWTDRLLFCLFVLDGHFFFFLFLLIGVVCGATVSSKHKPRKT